MKKYVSPAVEVVRFHAEHAMMLTASDNTLPENNDKDKTIETSDEIWTRRKRWNSPWAQEEE